MKRDPVLGPPAMAAIAKERAYIASLWPDPVEKFWNDFTRKLALQELAERMPDAGAEPTTR